MGSQAFFQKKSSLQGKEFKPAHGRVPYAEGELLHDLVTFEFVDEIGHQIPISNGYTALMFHNKEYISESKLQPCRRGAFRLAGKWRLLVAILAAFSLFCLFLPRIWAGACEDPGAGGHDVWQRGVSIAFLVIPFFIVLFCKSVTIEMKAARGIRTVWCVLLLICIAIAGWKLPGMCTLARYYINPEHHELALQLNNRQEIVFHENTDEKVVAITFDDGPAPNKTEAILDILKEEGVHATFFLSGDHIAKQEKVVAREYAEGHEIGNHSWTHLNLAFCSASKIREEFEKTSEAIASVTGKRPTLARPPYGRINLMGVRCIRECGMLPVFWTSSSFDYWRDGDEMILSRIRGEHPHTDIFLFHDFSSSPYVVREAIKEFRNRGYRFVTVSELLQLARRDKQLE